MRRAIAALILWVALPGVLLSQANTTGRIGRATL